MAEQISRDAAQPFVADDHSLAEFEGFAADVPRSDDLIRAVNTPDDSRVTRACAVRAAHLFAPGFIPPTLDPDAGEADLPTPDPVPADAQSERVGLHDLELSVPGLGPIPMWSFEDKLRNVQSWPAPTIRAREGQVVHSWMNSHHGPHTIHHHGIEPTPMNDGVGHLTFEVGSGKYAYQWLAGESGTYFYHCHRNTVLHFERGMYGLLVVDPDVAGAPFRDGGPGVVRVGNDLVPYAAEALWVADDIDLRWLELDVADGVQDVDDDARSGFMRIDDSKNPRFHDFRPTVFVVSGAAAAMGVADPLVASTLPGTPLTPRVRPGEKVLVRALCAAYAQTRWTFPTSLPGTVIATDGRTFGREPFGRYSSPKSLASWGHKFELTTARRYDVLVEVPASAAPGNYDVKVAFLHWITNAVLREVRVRIVVAA